MQNVTPPISASWTARALGRIASAVRRLVQRFEHPHAAPFIHWAEMRSIDFEGEDTSLTEAELRRYR